MSESVCSRCDHHSLCAGKVPIFQGLSRDELARIVRATGHREYAKEEILLHEGDRSETLFIVNEGQVKLTKLSRDGREQIIRILKSGDFFGELNIFGEGQAANFTARAMDGVKICSLSRSEMEGILAENPSIAVKLLSSLSRRVAETENLAHTLSSHDADTRTAFVLLELIQDHGRAMADGVLVRLPLSREELAAYAGLTRETLSRRLSDFEKRGLVRSLAPREILIPDPEKLRALV